MDYLAWCTVHSGDESSNYKYRKPFVTIFITKIKDSLDPPPPGMLRVLHHRLNLCRQKVLTLSDKVVHTLSFVIRLATIQCDCFMVT